MFDSAQAKTACTAAIRSSEGCAAFFMSTAFMNNLLLGMRAVVLRKSGLCYILVCQSLMDEKSERDIETKCEKVKRCKQLKI